MHAWMDGWMEMEMEKWKRMETDNGATEEWMNAWNEWNERNEEKQMNWK